MIVHLHDYSLSEEHNGCPYCAFQKLKRADTLKLKGEYLKLIAGKLNEIIKRIATIINTLDKGNLLITNIATNNLTPLGTILDRLENGIECVTAIDSIMYKTENISFGLGANRDLNQEQKNAIVEFNQEKLDAINFADFSHYIFIDDVYNTGDSFNVATEKLMELGIQEEDIFLITILNINNED